MLNFVSMKIIFSFQVAQNHRITDDVQLAIAIDFVQWFIQDLKLLTSHLSEWAQYNLATFSSQAGDGVMQFFSKGGVDVGCKAGLIDAFFLIDDRGCFVISVLPVPVPSVLLVSLPLLLLWIAYSHFFIIRNLINYQTSIYWVVSYPDPLYRHHLVFWVWTEWLSVVVCCLLATV